MSDYGAGHPNLGDSSQDVDGLSLEADTSPPSPSSTAAPSDLLFSPTFSGEFAPFQPALYPTTTSAGNACEHCISAGLQECLHGSDAFEPDPWSKSRDMVDAFARSTSNLRQAHEIAPVVRPPRNASGFPPSLQHDSSGSTNSTVTPASLVSPAARAGYSGVRADYGGDLSYSSRSWHPVNPTASLSVSGIPSTASWDERGTPSIATVDLRQASSSNYPELSSPSRSHRRRSTAVKIEEDDDQPSVTSPTSPTDPRSPTDHRRERNRVAARKCREKTKQTVEELQKKERELASDNTVLKATAEGLKDEVLSLKHNILSHGTCDSDVIQRYIKNQATKLRGSGAAQGGSTSGIGDKAKSGKESGR